MSNPPSLTSKPTERTRVYIEGGKSLRNLAKAKAAKLDISLEKFLGKAVEFAALHDEIVFSADGCQGRDNSVNKP